MATALIVEGLKQLEKSHGGLINNWFGGLMHITVQTSYDLKYLTMCLNGYMNAPTEPDFFLSQTWHVISHAPST